MESFKGTIEAMIAQIVFALTKRSQNYYLDIDSRNQQIVLANRSHWSTHAISSPLLTLLVQHGLRKRVNQSPE